MVNNKVINVNELDIFYISYDEPDCEKNYADLVSKAPWANRVHGVEGFDSAHKECARRSQTPRFITVDGDNIVKNEFFTDEVTLDIRIGGKPIDISEEEEKKCTYSWAGKNNINGLVYGNGGLKCWPVDMVLNMKTHEKSEDSRSAVEFCWDIRYLQIDNCYSDVYCHSSPFQAFRSGFREGVKMSLDEGNRVGPKDFSNVIYWQNLHRLLIWTSVGTDIENGRWAIYGSRLGANMTIMTSWDFRLIRDYKWFLKFWDEEISPKFSGKDETCMHTKYSWSKSKLDAEIRSLGNILKKDVGMDLAYMDEDSSAFFKKVYNPKSERFFQ